MTPRIWDLIGKRKWGYLFSLLLIVPSIGALIFHAVNGNGALNWGVDFTGGNFLHVKIEKPFTIGDIRSVVDRFATGQSIVQQTGQEAFIRTRPLGTDAKAGMLAALREQFGAVTVLREDEVGPKIGQELRNVAIIAVVLGLALQVLYISYRFKSVRYALTADAALVHDLLVLVGIFAVTRKEVNSGFVAILLTVLGYSMHDTIVVYDRIRENLAVRTREAFDRLVNRSLLEALVRSINTSLTAILAIAAVYFFGGVTIRDFAFGLMVGITTGTYSSTFSASALLVDWHLRSERQRGRSQREEPGPAAPAEAKEPVAAASSRQTGAGPRRRRSRRR